MRSRSASPRPSASARASDDSRGTLLQPPDQPAPAAALAPSAGPLAVHTYIRQSAGSPHTDHSTCGRLRQCSSAFHCCATPQCKWTRRNPPPTARLCCIDRHGRPCNSSTTGPCKVQNAAACKSSRARAENGKRTSQTQSAYAQPATTAKQVYAKRSDSSKGKPTHAQRIAAETAKQGRRR